MLVVKDAIGQNRDMSNLFGYENYKFSHCIVQSTIKGQVVSLQKYSPVVCWTQLPSSFSRPSDSQDAVASRVDCIGELLLSAIFAFVMMAEMAAITATNAVLILILIIC